MESEEKVGFDVEGFVDDGREKAGLEPEQSEAEQAAEAKAELAKKDEANEKEAAEQAEAKAKEEAGAKAKSDAEAAKEALEETETGEEDGSTIEDILETEVPESEPGPEPKKGTVPLEKHIKLRKRAQDAEAKLKELQDDIDAAKGIEEEDPDKKAEDDELADLEDDDFVSVKTLKQQQEKAAKERDKQTKLAKAEKAKATLGNLVRRAGQFGAQFEKDHPDFNKVLKTADDLHQLPAGVKRQALLQPDPAKYLYEYCQERLTTLREGLGVGEKAEKPTKKETETDEERKAREEAEAEENLSDEEIFNDIFGGGKEG